MKQYVLFIMCFSAVITMWCMPVSSNEITELKNEVSQLQIELREIQFDSSDLYTKSDSILLSLGVINASIQDLQNKVSILDQIVRSFGININKNSKDDYNEPVILPLHLYQRSYGDYSMGKFDLAYSGFKTFVDKYPDAELAPQAQFYMGECFYSRNIWKQSLEEYRKIEEYYKKSNLVPSARLKIGLCYDMLGKNNEAINVFLSIVKDFPESQESLAAEGKIEIYKNAHTS
jgi:tol-pal system protein YbgF